MKEHYVVYIKYCNNLMSATFRDNSNNIFVNIIIILKNFHKENLNINVAWNASARICTPSAQSFQKPAA